MLKAMETKAPGASVELEAHVTCVCPVNGRQDHGLVRLAYRAGSQVLELGSLRDYLQAFAPVEMLHEDLTAIIKRDAQLRAGVPVTVTTEWAAVEGVKATVTL